jgi:hypothetical protein
VTTTSQILISALAYIEVQDRLKHQPWPREFSGHCTARSRTVIAGRSYTKDQRVSDQGTQPEPKVDWDVRRLSATAARNESDFSKAERSATTKSRSGRGVRGSMLCGTLPTAIEFFIDRRPPRQTSNFNFHSPSKIF